MSASNPQITPQLEDATPQHDAQALLNLLVAHLDNIRIPGVNDKVYKDECIYSFDTPDSPDGIYVCLRTFRGFNRFFATLFNRQHPNSSVFLNLRRKAHLKKVNTGVNPSPPVGVTALPTEAQLPVGDEPPPSPSSPAKAATAPTSSPKAEKSNNNDSDGDGQSAPKITKLALNVEGGFFTSDTTIEYEEMNQLVVLSYPSAYTEIPLSHEIDLPEKVVMAVSGILSAQSASKMAELENLQNTWDGEERKISKHSNTLVQLNNGVKVPLVGWKCENCDITDGLWLNLTDGKMLCGRKNFDGTGGNNHAVEHYERTHYPLAVKLGTITPEGADVYSYDEDNMVIDTNLEAHLAHFGINIATMHKTEKSMLEMEIDLNMNFNEWSVIQEDGCKLVPVYGPGFTGMINLGNTCYINSVMQVLFSIPDFIREFYRADCEQQFNESDPTDPVLDIRSQFMKLASGLLSGKYSVPLTGDAAMIEQTGIKPNMFRHAITRNHREFRKKAQQDAQEFFLYILDLIEALPPARNSTSSNISPSNSADSSGSISQSPTDCFRFELEERVECSASHQVAYKNRREYMMSLPCENIAVQNSAEYDEFLSLKKAIEETGGKVEPDQVVHPIIKLTDCIKSYCNETIIEDWQSPVVKRRVNAKMRFRFNSFPDYLIIQMQRFAFNPDWSPRKLDISLDVPDFLDIEHLRAGGRQPNEELLPDDGSANNSPNKSTTSSTGADSGSTSSGSEVFEFNSTLLQHLTSMGYNVEACKRALYNTQTEGSIEAAMDWIFQHEADANFNDEFVVPGSKPVEVQVDQKALDNLLLMGIELRHAQYALKKTNNNTERAIDYIFADIGNLDEEIKAEERAAQASSASSSTNTRQDASTPTVRDGHGQYKLMGFISHMGQSTHCGHYVCHIRKELPEQVLQQVTSMATGSSTTPMDTGEPDTATTTTNVKNDDEGESDGWKWCIFNDNKVAISEKPPVQFAYMYVYKRLANPKLPSSPTK